MSHALGSFESLERGEQDSPCGTLTAAARSNHHQTVAQLADLVQLQHLSATCGDKKNNNVICTLNLISLVAFVN